MLFERNESVGRPSGRLIKFADLAVGRLTNDRKKLASTNSTPSSSPTSQNSTTSNLLR